MLPGPCLSPNPQLVSLLLHYNLSPQFTGYITSFLTQRQQRNLPLAVYPDAFLGRTALIILYGHHTDPTIESQHRDNKLYPFSSHPSNESYHFQYELEVYEPTLFLQETFFSPNSNTILRVNKLIVSELSPTIPRIIDPTLHKTPHHPSKHQAAKFHTPITPTPTSRNETRPSFD